MPIVLARPHLDRLLRTAKLRPSNASIEIALVNNMPDAALESTERQFMKLLDAAATGVLVRLHLISLPQVPRPDAARRTLASRYFDVAELWNARLDGLIVTGTEPRTSSLRDEPYWGTLTRLVDWAEDNAIASIWSCLAAHAAVLHNDGIARRPLADKRFGLFECAKVSDHPLMDGMPPRLRIAHSRWNELPEDELQARHYTILTRSVEAGVDAFAKGGKSLSLFFQGHPEYDERALLREYRRDVRRYLRRERDAYPLLPQGYFDAGAAFVLDGFRERALTDRREDLMANFPSADVQVSLAKASSSAAARIYANWLRHLLAERAQRRGVRARANEPRPARVHISGQAPELKAH